MTASQRVTMELVNHPLPRPRQIPLRLASPANSPGGLRSPESSPASSPERRRLSCPGSPASMGASWSSHSLRSLSRGHTPISPSFEVHEVRRIEPSSYGGLEKLTEAHLNQPSPDRWSDSYARLVRTGWDGRTHLHESARSAPRRESRISTQTICMKPRAGRKWAANGPGGPPASPSTRSAIVSRRLGLPPTEVTERLVFLSQRDLFLGR